MNEDRLDPQRTTWHITFGTYGARLHGGDRPTVERDQNQLGDEFVHRNDALYTSERNLMNNPPVYLTHEQQTVIEATIPAICRRGGWRLRTCSAGVDHVHVIVDAIKSVHGKQIRELVKRWLTQALNDQFETPPGGRWWAKGGSTKVIDTNEYLHRAVNYVNRQRATAAP